MLYFLDASYSKDNDAAMLQYFGPGDGPKYCGAEKNDNEFGGMLKFLEGRMCDFIYIKPGVMACTPEVKKVLGEEMMEDAQFLPMVVHGVELFVINITNVVDALDHEYSTIKCLPDGRIMKIDPCVIDEGVLPQCLLFKIPQNSCKAFFGTERLKRLIEKHGFYGLRFIPLPFSI